MLSLPPELADMTMSYYEREPRGAGMTMHQDLAPVCRCRGWRRCLGPAGHITG